MIEAHPADLDEDPISLPASITVRREGIEMLAGDLGVEWDRFAKDELRVEARHKADAEGAALVDAMRLNNNALWRVFAEAAAKEIMKRARSKDLGAIARGEIRDIDRMIEMRMAREEDMRFWYSSIDELAIDGEGTHQEHLAHWCPREIRIDDKRRALIAQAKARGAEPFDGEAARKHAPPVIELELKVRASIVRDALFFMDEVLDERAEMRHGEKIRCLRPARPVEG